MTLPTITTSSRPVTIQQTSTQSNGHYGPYSGAFTLTIRLCKKNWTQNLGYHRDLRVYKPYYTLNADADYKHIQYDIESNKISRYL